MNWRVKAHLQSLLSRLPLGHQLNFALRRYVSRSVPASMTVFRKDLSFAREHIESFRRHGLRPVEEASFYEFGVGWDLTIPLSLYLSGARNQLLIDLYPLVKADLVAKTARRLLDECEQPGPKKTLEQLAHATTLQELRCALQECCSIEYRAPFDARRTGFDDSRFDYITATKVLAQIPVEDLRRILCECHRLLRPGGLIRVLNDYRDMYSYVDPSISVYNFLQFSDQEWRRFNPGLNYQNRLRHIDHIRMFAEAGFEIIEEQPGYDHDKPCQVLATIPLADKFRDYSLNDLAPVRGVILAHKPV
jgi:SAM-dependent methyltransferase